MSDGVGDARPAGFRRLSASLGRAFVDDPAWAWVYPEADRDRRLTTMFRSLLAAVNRRGGTVLTDGSEQGAAIWQPAEQRSLGARGNLAMGVAMARGRADMARCRVLARELEDRHPDEPHWYLTTLGTDPAHQGSGVGSALVRHFLDHRARADEAAYLEVLTEANVGFYSRFGFEVIDQFDVPSDGPHVWQMWREGARGSQSPPGR